MTRLESALRSEWLATRTQIALGAIFVVAALPKIADPPTFAKNVWAFDILPDPLVNAVALVLPGVELITGLLLILGLWPRAGAVLCTGMLATFMVALAWALVEGNPVSCSCFELEASPKSDEELLGEMRGVLVRDFGILAIAGHVIWARTVGLVASPRGT